MKISIFTQYLACYVLILEHVTLIFHYNNHQYYIKYFIAIMLFLHTLFDNSFILLMIISNYFTSIIFFFKFKCTLHLLQLFKIKSTILKAKGSKSHKTGIYDKLFLILMHILMDIVFRTVKFKMFY